MGIGDLALAATFLFIIFDGHKWVAARLCEIRAHNNH